MPMKCEYIVVHDDAVHITHNKLLIFQKLLDRAIIP